MSRSSCAGMLALFASACAISEPPQPDRQTHWMQACDSDDECGDFECACGVCTLSCAGDLACDMGEALDAACIGSAASPAAALCGRGAPGGALCLPSCSDDASCRALGAGLRCIDAACVPEPPAAAAIAQPLEIDCNELDGQSTPPGIEVVASGVIFGFAATEGGVSWATEDSIVGLPAGASEPRVLAPALDAHHLAMDGEQLVWLENRFDEVRLHAVSVARGGGLELDRRASLDLVAFDLELSRDSAFWGASGDLLRSPRTPGASEVVLSDPGMLGIPHALMLDDDNIYYLRSNDGALGDNSVIQVPLDGDVSQSRTVVRGPILVTALDDGYLYYGHTTLETLLSPVQEDRTIRRLRLDGDGTPEILLRTQATPAGLVVAGGYLYYSLVILQGPYLTSDVPIEFWRLPLDGSEEPRPLIRSDAFSAADTIPTVVVVDREIYWLARCVRPDWQRDFLLRFALP